jgi:hypothetical protein
LFDNANLPFFYLSSKFVVGISANDLRLKDVGAFEAQIIL